VFVVCGAYVALPNLLALAITIGTRPAQGVTVALWTVERDMVLLPIAAAQPTTVAGALQLLDGQTVGLTHCRGGNCSRGRHMELLLIVGALFMQFTCCFLCRSMVLSPIGLLLPVLALLRKGARLASGAGPLGRLYLGHAWMLV